MRDLKDLQKSLNQTQRIRLQSALQQLQEIYSRASSSPAATAAVSVSDSIHVNLEDGVLKGHGTTNRNDDVVATVCGFVERVNKLVYVRDLRARYKPEVGDIIVGRVIEVVSKRWRLEINFSQDAVLMLSSMNLPDGMQRRQTATDELNMRSIFEENDVICAEVRGFNNHDGTLQLQARSQKYGKLERGQMLTVPSFLVKRRKQHFHNLEQYGVDMILGCNGFIWVGEHVEHDISIPVETVKSNIENMSMEEHKPNNFTPLETRQGLCRIANAIRVLSTLGCALSVEAILNTVEWSISSNVEVKDMLLSEFCVQAAEIEVQRRIPLTKRKN